MRYREIKETDYIQSLMKKIGAGSGTGAPVPTGVLPKGTIKSIGAKQVATQINKDANKDLLKPGKMIPIPVGPNQEKDMEIDKVDADTVSFKNLDPQPGEPPTTTLNKKDLNPVINNLLRRQRAQG
tara:strand:- start:14219 stop:14596 length:378 start_codon:yes stop_codon:yes gene_type:complete